MKRVAIYCGSSSGTEGIFYSSCKELAKELIKKDIGVVYGGTSIGLMGIIADEMIKGGAEVIGVIPQMLVDREISHRGLKDLRVVNSMHERKALMAELADAFIALPGGIGTLEELLEVLTWTKLGIHKKPCGILNINGFYDLLNDLLQNLVSYGFLKEEHKKLLVFEEDPKKLIEGLYSSELNLINYKF